MCSCQHPDASDLWFISFCALAHVPVALSSTFFFGFPAPVYKFPFVPAFCMSPFQADGPDHPVTLSVSASLRSIRERISQEGPEVAPWPSP